ncbi:hypothetical protein AQ490_05935 [Wenjunlia vitaminophila]|uniref:Uncharacterized protein n=1 Tax=Wenjunlia vitaminophila TaxID=76728 RepID=A0A0T6LPA7_WENVI|nr:hypothetical protein [Wenjunlia vitaminophila]KRV47894.1 hypothetical protein AQ490_05935 [Wenjunlia vitaminophila]
MTLYDGFLMRDSLSDTGTVPSPGYPYHSPDIVSHSQVSDPGRFLTDTYDRDPTQPVELGSRLNPVYVRAKNLSSRPLTGYHVSVFRANTSLFLRPSVWSGHPLRTASGATSVALPPTVAPGAVGVGQDYFLLDAISSNEFCCVGMVSETPHPTIPADFPSYDAYILWVRQNQNVCGRNLNLVRDYPNRAFERLDTFSNPSSSEHVPTLFEVTVSGALPAGSRFGIQCVALGISTNWPTSEGPVQTESTMTPPSFDGAVTTWALLPTGAAWPRGASVDTTVWVGIRPESQAAAYHTPLERLGVSRTAVEGLGDAGVLVRLGNSGTVFVSSREAR